MTTDSSQNRGKKSGYTVRPVLDTILKAVRTTPLRMPAGGWLKEIATNEEWRTTTIVRRHRDRAMMTPPS